LLGDHPLITVPYRHPRSKHVFHQYTLKLNNRGEGPGLRDHLAQHLTDSGIPHGVYYPKPIHKQAAFADVVSESVVLPHTDDLTQRVISLPMHTELTEEQQERVAQHIQEGLNSYL
ncbi:MAG: DegT/DnrJ/EryC1/StrS family aminotransferase, partial [Flavobacteriales bacterium]|nr:DegT/DnrJ/EryC1/StrS family aminotransferase [Flavobacteriales bacterium]